MMSFLLDIDQKDTKYRGLLYSIEYNSMNISYKLYISPFLCKRNIYRHMYSSKGRASTISSNGKELILAPLSSLQSSCERLNDSDHGLPIVVTKGTSRR